MSDVVELERRVGELENFYTDIPEMLNLRLDRNDAAHAEHSARLSIIDKQLAALTRDLRDMRGGVTRQLVAQDQRLAALEERLAAIDRRLDANDSRFDAIDGRLDAIDGRFDAIDGRFDAIDGRLDAIDRRFDVIDGHLGGIETQLTRIVALLERK